MTSATRESFTAYMGSPNTLFVIVMVLMASVLGVCLLKIVLTAWDDIRTDSDFHVADFFVTVQRMLLLILIFGLLFFH